MRGPAPWLARLFHPFPKQEGIRLATIPPRDTELKERLHGARSTPLLWGLASAGINALIGSTPRQLANAQPAPAPAQEIPASAGSTHDTRQPGRQPRRLTAQACLCLAVLQRLLPGVGLIAAQAAMDGAEDPLQQLLYVCRSGVTACLLINCLAPDTIDERALHMDFASQPQLQAQLLHPPTDAAKTEAGRCSSPGHIGTHDGTDRALTIKLGDNTQEPAATITPETDATEAILTAEASAEAANSAIPDRVANQPTTAPTRTTTTAPLGVPVSPHSILCDDPLAGSLHPLAPDSSDTLGSSPGDGVLHQDLTALSLQTDWFDAETAGVQGDGTAHAGHQQQQQLGARERQQVLWNWQLAHGSAVALGCSLEGMPAEALARGEGEMVVSFIMELLKFSYMQVLSPDVAPGLLALCAPGESESDLACAAPLTLLTRWVEHYVPGLATPATHDPDHTTSHALRTPVTPKPRTEPASLSSSSGGTTQWIHVAARDLAPGSSSPSQCESPRLDCPAPLPVPEGHASVGPADDGEDAAGALGIHALAQLLRALQPSTRSTATSVADAVQSNGCTGVDHGVGGLAEVQAETDEQGQVHTNPGTHQGEGSLDGLTAGDTEADQQLQARLASPQGERIDERAAMLLLAGQVVAQAAALGVDLPMQGWWLLEGGAPVRLLLLLAVARAVLTPPNTSALAQAAFGKTVTPETPRNIGCKQASNSVAADSNGSGLAHQTLEPHETLEPQQEVGSRQGQEAGSRVESGPGQEVERVQGQEPGSGQGQEAGGQGKPWQEAGGQGQEAGGQGQEAGCRVDAQAAGPQQEPAPQEASESHADTEAATAVVPDSPTPSAFATALAAAQQSSGSALRTRSRRRQGPEASSPSPGPPGWQNMQLRHTIGPSRVGEDTATQVRDVSALLHASRQDGVRPAAVGHRGGRELLQGHGEEVDRQEERLLRSWLNSLLVDRNMRVTSLFDAAMCTGWPLLVACDIMAPDCVNWARAFPPPYNGKRVPRKLMAVENGNQVCHICTHVWHLPLVNIGGVDVAEGHKGALTALVWQLMRHHMTLLLGPLVHPTPASPAYRLSPTPSSAGYPPLPHALGSGGGSVHSPRATRTTPGLEPRLSASACVRSHASVASSAHHPSSRDQLHQIEEEVLRWANAKLAEQGASGMGGIEGDVAGGKSWRISSLNDPCLANGQVLLVLLARIRPSAINPAHVLPGTTTHEKLANARMVICVARGLGAKVYMAADDLAEGRPRAVLMLLAALMACDRAIQAEK